MHASCLAVNQNNTNSNYIYTHPHHHHHIFSMSPQLHFLLIPLMSQSHIIPLTDLGKLLARRGLTVSIITTPRNFLRYKPTISHAVKAGLNIQMIPLEFPGQEAGLPQGCENMDTLSSLDLAKEFFTACEMLAAPLEKLMAQMHPKPSCIVSTNALPWTQKVAHKFNIPRYIFETISCFSLLCSYILDQDHAKEMMADSETVAVPGIPHKIEFTKAQLPVSTKKSSDHNIDTILDEIKRARKSARATLVNSFEEMEDAYVQGYREVARTLWCIGPVSLVNKNSAEKSDRGSKASIDEQRCMSWLDSKEPGSVVYACFGSLCRISAEQIREIGLGLEASGFPFIWIIRGMDSSPEVVKWLEEEKLEERVGGRGLIICGWAPQVLILSHGSVGGFVTHCGWNSTLEGVSAGVPMLTWPMFAEQFYNEKLIVQVLKTGVRVGVEVDFKKEALVKRERVKKGIQKLMAEEDEEGRERRRRAKKLAEMARQTLEEDGSSYRNITLFIQDVMQLTT